MGMFPGSKRSHETHLPHQDIRMSNATILLGGSDVTPAEAILSAGSTGASAHSAEGVSEGRSEVRQADKVESHSQEGAKFPLAGLMVSDFEAAIRSGHSTFGSEFGKVRRKMLAETESEGLGGVLALKFGNTEDSRSRAERKEGTNVAAAKQTKDDLLSSLTPGGSSIPTNFIPDDCRKGDAVPFQGQGNGLVITAGYAVVMAVTAPMGLLNLDEGMWVQVRSSHFPVVVSEKRSDFCAGQFDSYEGTVMQVGSSHFK